MLAKRGRLQAILSAGVLFREDTLTKTAAGASQTTWRTNFASSG